MGLLGKLAPVAIAAGFTAGCVTYPYETAFSACDNLAGACYRSCEPVEDEADYGACHQSCEAEASICFDQAYSDYRYASSSRYGYSAYGPSPWYGDYGYWRPGAGYYFSFSSGYYGGRYGYRDRYYDRGYRHRYGDRRGRYRDGDGRRGRDQRRRSGSDGNGGSGGTSPPARQPRTSPPPRSAPPASSAPPPRNDPPPRTPRTKDFPDGDID